MARWLRLMGKDYPELGPLGTVGFPDGGGVALSRGLYPKAYKHTDPNEDGALVYFGADSALLAVVDGHTGAAASEVAMDVLCARADTLLEAATDDVFADAVVSLVHKAQEAIRHVGRSYTCLSLATVRGAECRWANFGDSSVFRTGRPEPVHGPNDLVLGDSLGPWPRGSLPWWGSFQRQPDERVFAVTDGVTNFAKDPLELATIVHDAPDDRSAASSLATYAMEGGAGDNVAAAVVGTYPPRP